MFLTKITPCLLMVKLRPMSDKAFGESNVSTTEEQLATSGTSTLTLFKSSIDSVPFSVALVLDPKTFSTLSEGI